jgi:hypothetical protein
MSTPTLPPELWLAAIKAASDVPGALDTSLLVPPDRSPRSYSRVIKESSSYTQAAHVYRSADDPEKVSFDAGARLSLKTKMSSVLVSSTWKKLAMPLLYEHISLRRIEHVRSCARALESNLQSVMKKEGSNDERTQYSTRLGWHTKRLDIAFSSFNRRSVDWSPEDVQHLSFILKACPNLKIVIMDTLSGAPWESEFVSQLIEDHIQLRHLQWGEGHTKSLPSCFFFNNLEVLFLTDAAEYCETLQTKATLPNLHTLGIFDLGGGAHDSDARVIALGLADWELPALRRLVIGAYSLENGGMLPLFQKFASQLLSLDIETSLAYNPIPNLLAMCSSLQELCASCIVIDETPEQHPPHLAEIYLRFFASPHDDHTFIEEMGSEEHRMASIHMKGFISCMNALFRSRGPELRVIQFIDFDVSGFAEESHRFRPSHLAVWTEWVEKWADAGVRFEDKFGKLIEIPRWIDKSSEDYQSDEAVEDGCLVLEEGSDYEEDWE